jgi:hypothetical protein
LQEVAAVEVLFLVVATTMVEMEVYLMEVMVEELHLEDVEASKELEVSEEVGMFRVNMVLPSLTSKEEVEEDLM